MDNEHLRDLQLCEYEILKVLDDICKKENLQYYLAAGTLLGAVRHHGFIPWDDDVDVIMPVDDFIKFNEVAKKHLGDQYFLQTSKTDPDYGYLFTKIRKNGTTLMSPWERNNPGHHGVWVDIFPIIPINNKMDYYVKKTTVRFSNFLCMNDVLFNYNYEYLVKRSNPILMKAIAIMRKTPADARKRLHLKIQKALLKSNPKASSVGIIWTNITLVVPKHLFDGKPEMLTFETQKFPVMPEYDEFLTRQYGDYMTPPPENQRNGGHGMIIVDLEKELW
ncbi:MAG: LicD family protein [Erysipelotrichaceae bacterium]|nr:LicD family protein [Erysipelotrichaceae bacterium]